MNDLIATDAAPKFSSPGKMPCPTWSLQAIDTCPGSIGDDGKLVPACSNCYATKGFYHMGTVKAPREHNLQDWKNDGWVAAMVAEVSKHDRWRWFDSGDMYHIGLARKILEVMRRTPDTDHWLPTRMYKFEKFKPVLAAMGRLPNVVVRKSSDSITGGRIRGKNTSTIINQASQARGAHVCPATVKGNSPKCKANNCYACWDKSVAVVAYNFH